MKVVIACAGSGGHINPGIAIANEIKRNNKTADILFLGTKTGLENELVKNAKYNIVRIRAGRLHRYFTIENVKNVCNAVIGIFDAKKVLKEFNPDLVIGTGGYICLPVCKAAQKLNIPYVLHESNACPGMSIKLSAKYASKILVGFEAAKSRLENNNIVCTGTPAKFDVLDMEKLNKSTCVKNLGLENICAMGKKIVFVTGGSQGAQKINEIVINMVKKFLSKEYYIIIAVGHLNYDEVMNMFKDKELENLKDYIRVEKFVYDMEQMYKVADLMITRAGAMTVTELAICSKPAILIPLPSAAENHQMYNAQVIEKIGGGLIIQEKELTKELLNKTLTSIVTDENKLKEMSNNAFKLYVPNVNKKIYNELEEYWHKKHNEV